MLLKKQAAHKFILLFAGSAVLIPAILLYLNPAAVFPDPSWGFQVMRSMQQGGAFNFLVSPDQQDIAKNTSAFLTWWSPGQYLIPYFWISVFDSNVAHAAALTTIFCQFAGLAGFYFLFKKAGFTPLVSSLSLLFIVCQQAFFSPYIFYNGGETLLFAFLGWFLYGCLSPEKTGLRLAVFVLLSGWIGFVCKSSFIWMYAAGLLSIWIRLSPPGRATFKELIVNGLWVGIPALIAVAVIYLTFLSKGGNPSSDSQGFRISFNALAYPLASPLLAGFSADDLANGLIYHNDRIIFSAPVALAILALLAVLSLLLVYIICKRIPYKGYRSLLVIFYTVSILFFGFAYLRQLNISYEARHFRILGLLIAPAVLYLASGAKPVYRVVFGFIVLFITFFSLRFYSLSYIALRTETARGPSGIAQQFIDQPSLDYITMLDRKNRDAIFVFLSPDLALEIRHNRVITLEPLTDDISINFDESVQKGHAGPVYILMPSDYTGIRANVLLKCFPGYKGFSLKELSDDYVLYYATQAR